MHIIIYQNTTEDLQKYETVKQQQAIRSKRYRERQALTKSEAENSVYPYRCPQSFGKRMTAIKKSLPADPKRQRACVMRLNEALGIAVVRPTETRSSACI